MDWTRSPDSHGSVVHVPELLARVEREDDSDSWKKLGYRLVLEGTLVFPASFAALPILVRLAPASTQARELVGAILRCAGANHGCDHLLAEATDTIAEFRKIVDLHLRSRPADYLTPFVDLVAARGEYHWSAVLDDFTDDFYHLACPQCAVRVTIAIGDHGRYSAIRDWHQGNVDRRDLRPASPGELSGIGQWMHETAKRDGQEAFADGIAHLFGTAECPRCACAFSIADEYVAANREPTGEQWS